MKSLESKKHRTPIPERKGTQEMNSTFTLVLFPGDLFKSQHTGMIFKPRTVALRSDRGLENRSDLGAEVAAGISMTRFKIGRRYAEKEPHKSDRSVLELLTKYLHIHRCVKQDSVG